MKFCIESLKFWYPNCDLNPNLQSYNLEDNKDFSWPKLDFIPSMQRRRLSHFAKMALHVAYLVTENSNEQLPMVFSSRHGDSHKTSSMLDDLAHDSAISPTAFSLSVHNAVPGLFSIINNNKNAINAVAAGQDSLFMAIVDAYARIKSGQFDRVLVVHVDQDLPDLYKGFIDELQIPHAVAFILSIDETNNSESVECTFGAPEEGEPNENNLPLALSFIQWFNSSTPNVQFFSSNYFWHFNKYV